MALYINRYSQPVHVVVLSGGEVVDTDGGGEHVSGAAEGDDTEMLCGVSLSDANNDIPLREANILRVSQMGRWESLADFVSFPDLCPDCREKMAEAWPPAAAHIGKEEAAEGLGELFG